MSICEICPDNLPEGENIRNEVRDILRFKTTVISLITAAVLCLSLMFTQFGSAETAAATGVAPEVQAKMFSIQVPFVPNEGQINDDQVKFYAKTFAGTVFVTSDGITYDLPKGGDGGWVLQEEFAGGNSLAPSASSVPGAPVNYYLGKMEKHLASYQEITLGEVYDKINVNLRAYGNNVEKIFTVAPGGDPGNITLKVSGADKLTVNEQGELELATGLGTVKMTSPTAYQVIDGRRVDVTVAYAVNGDSYGFKVGEYNRAFPLVIDPLLASTYIGGGASDGNKAIALDAAGNVYVAGSSSSTYFFLDKNGNTLTGGYSQVLNGTASDAFVAKLDGDLSQFLAATYLGGGAPDAANAITLDGSGNVYVAGNTKSLNSFPSTLVPCQDGANNDIFVAKLDGDQLNRIDATCFGGSMVDFANAISLDATGHVFVAGYTQSDSFLDAAGQPLTVTGLQTSRSGSQDGLVVKFSDDLSQVLASTYLGGSEGSDNLLAMAIDDSGNVYVGGNINSSYNHAASALRTEYKGGSNADGIVFELNNDLNSLVASTFVGGIGGNTYVRSMTFDAAGNVVVTGETSDTSFPTTTGTTPAGPQDTHDAFVIKIKSNLTGDPVGDPAAMPLASTLFGGSGNEYSYAVDLDAGGNVYIAGRTFSGSLPGNTGDSYQQGLSGGSGNDAFVAKFVSNLSNPVSTYIGGAGSDYCYGVALNPAGNVYVAGQTGYNASVNFPTAVAPGQSRNAQETRGAGNDAYVAKLTGDLLSLAAAPPDSTAPIWPAGRLDESNVTDTGLTLTWSGAMDNTGVTGYRIYRDGSVIDNVYANSPTCDVTGLDAGTPYTFKVEASDAAGNWSTDGPSKTVTTTGTYADHTRPAWPADKSLTATDIAVTSLTLTWTPATDNVGVTDYKVFQNTVEIATVSSAVYTTVSGAVYYSYSVTNLAPGNPYNFKVEAVDAAGNVSIDGPSTDVTTTNPDTSPPFWPGEYSLGEATWNALSPTKMYLEWSPASDNVGVTGYHIYIKNPPNAADWSVLATVYGTTNCIITLPDTPGIGYPVSIRAFDAAGNLSAYAYPASLFPGESDGVYLIDAYLTAIAAGVPPVSINGPSIDDGANVPLKAMFKMYFKNNVVNNDGDNPVWPGNQQCFTLQTTAGGVSVPIKVVRIPDDPDGFNERNNIFVTPVNELAPNTQYKLTISPDLMPKNKKRSMSFERVVNFTTEAAASGTPAWPSGGTMTASNPTPSGVTLTWTPADSGAGVTSYIIIKNNSDIIRTVDGATTSCDITGLISGTTYTFQVQAFNSTNYWTSDGPSVAVTTTVDTAAPAWPADSTLTATGATSTGLTLTWSAATDDAAVTGYQIYKDGTLYTTVSGGTLTCNVTGLNPGTTYAFKVEAGDAAGHWTSDGPSVTAATPADTTAPVWPSGSALTVSNILDTALTLTWSAATDDAAVTGYQIYKDGTLYTTVSGSTLTCNVTGLTAGITYSFQVQAGDAAGHWTTDGPSAGATTAASGGSANYTVTPAVNSAYTIGETADGIDTMTAHSSGPINFIVDISPVTAHPGTEKAVFVHLRNNLQVGLSTAVADFDTVTAAQAAFNVQPGDVVKVYIVDDLNTAVDTNPVVLE